MRYEVLVVVLIVLGGCSYERSFEESFHSVGFDLLSELVEASTSTNCRFGSYDEASGTIDEGIAALEDVCLLENTPHSSVLVRHPGNTFEPVWLRSSDTLVSREGWLTYSDMIGFVMTSSTHGMMNESLFAQMDSADQLIERLIEEDRSLKNDEPGLIIFFYHPEFTWGVGKAGSLMIDDVKYHLETEGWVFRVPDLVLEPGSHTLTFGTEHYDFFVEEPLVKIVDWVVTDAEITLLIDNALRETITSITIGECESLDTATSQATVTVSSSCDPSDVVVETTRGVNSFRFTDISHLSPKHPHFRKTVALEPSFLFE